ncbi:MAG: site-specific integrase [Bacteroidales bacterium]|nr:site-specific integrase [Bacteroidales bacterium]
MTGSLQDKKGKHYMVFNLKNPDGSRYQKWVPTGFPINRGYKSGLKKILRETVKECNAAECQDAETLTQMIDTITSRKLEAEREAKSQAEEPQITAPRVRGPLAWETQGFGDDSETSDGDKSQEDPKPVGRTREKADRKRPTNIKQLNKDTLFSDAVRVWLKDCEAHIDEVTVQGYTLSAKNHVLPYFDELGVSLGEVNRSILQEFFDQKHANGRKDGKGGLKTTSLKRIKTVMYQTLDLAVREEIIPGNPCALVKLPPSEPFESSFYTADQISKLLDCVKDDVLYPTIKLTAVYGLRRSEVLGLKWDSVDFESGLITIKHTVSKVTKVVLKDKTKNRTSRRSFPLLPEIRDLLLELKEKENENRKLYGRVYNENDYILKWDNGTPINPDFVTSHFQKLLKDHHLPHIRFHELRHSCASILLNDGCTLKDVQEWMGHADIKMTANIYGHLDVARKQYLADRMSSSIFGGEGTQS